MFCSKRSLSPRKPVFDERICKINVVYQSGAVPVAVVSLNKAVTWYLIKQARQILPSTETSQPKCQACNYLLDLRINAEPYKSAPLRQLTGGRGECLRGKDSDRVCDQGGPLRCSSGTHCDQPSLYRGAIISTCYRFNALTQTSPPESTFFCIGFCLQYLIVRSRLNPDFS